MQLVIVDTTQIQRYIFNSNRLRENIGASHLVVQATRDWALENLATPHNVEKWTDAEIIYNDARRVERDQLASELLYTGGGNFVVIFREETDAKAFIRKLSRKALCEAPGLELLIVRYPFNWNDSLVTAMKGAFERLGEEKRTRSRSAPLLGMGVTALCRSTGLPAIGLTPKIEGDVNSVKLASAEILAKHGAIEHAKKRVAAYLPLPDNYSYGVSVDDLGRTIGEHSFIGVVHADGDGIG